MAKLTLASAGAALVLFALAASPAQAAVVRAWVSGHGADVAGCGAPSAPCRTLQYAFTSIVSPGGEIDILDPAGYGTLVIDHAIGIVNDGVGTAGVQAASGNAITIDAGPGDKVYLRGLDIDGLQGGGTNGIEFKAGGALTVTDCVVRHFSLIGLLIDPASGTVSVGIRNSQFLENYIGLEVGPPSNSTAGMDVVVDRVVASGNGYGGMAAFSISASGMTRMTISNSDASRNLHYGAAGEADSIGNVLVEVNNSTLSSNGASGALILGKGVMHIARSVLDFNATYAIDNGSSAPGGVFSSGDNHAEGSGLAATNGPTPTLDTLH